MKFEKLGLDKFDSHALTDDGLFKIVGGVGTEYTVRVGVGAGKKGKDTRTGSWTEYTSGPWTGQSGTDYMPADGSQS